MKFEAYEPKQYEMHTPSKVDFNFIGKNSFAMLDDTFKVNLDPRGQLASMASLGIDPNDLKSELLEGRFFIVDNQVVDHRFKSNLKFEHTADSIKNLVNKLGLAQRAENQPGFQARGRRQPIRSSKIEMKATREAFEVNPIDLAGGLMDINIGFNWSPFELDIHSVIEMWRQVCSNGAIASSPILDNRIPMLNRWEENLRISDHVVRHNFDKLVLPRLQAMPTERITLADVQALQKILSDLQSSKQLHHDSTQSLISMSEKVNEAWLPGAGSMKKNMLKFVEAPMTAFDAYNVVTEASTHHLGRDKTSSQSQAFISSLIFNTDRRRASRTELDSLLCDTNTFANPDQAFFGLTCH